MNVLYKTFKHLHFQQSNCFKLDTPGTYTHYLYFQWGQKSTHSANLKKLTCLYTQWQQTAANKHANCKGKLVFWSSQTLISFRLAKFGSLENFLNCEIHFINHIVLGFYRYINTLQQPSLVGSASAMSRALELFKLQSSFQLKPLCDSLTI